jgi:UDP-arabinose 4-epimerase
LNLLEAARDHRSNQFSSTCATYQISDRLPITEDMPQRRIDSYGASRLMGEFMRADFGAAHGLRSIVLRYISN